MPPTWLPWLRPTPSSPGVTPPPYVVDMTELQPIPISEDLLRKLADGTLADWELLVQEITTTVSGEPPEILPLPAKLKPEEQAAIDAVSKVYGSVVPTAHRTLTEGEIAALLTERDTLAKVKAAVERRLTDVRLTVLNHSDAAFKEGDTEGVVVVDGKPCRDKDGHVVRDADYLSSDDVTGTHFSLEPASGSPTLSESALERLSKDPEVDYIDHKDWLACTEQIRVWNPNKAMQHLKKNTQVLRAIREAMESGSYRVAVHQRPN